MYKSIMVESGKKVKDKRGKAKPFPAKWQNRSIQTDKKQGAAIDSLFLLILP